jgi:ankyrin repeat protein
MSTDNTDREQNIARRALKGLLTVEEVNHVTKEKLETEFDDGWTTLYCATSGSSVDVVQAIIDRGVNINAFSINDWTTITAAASNKAWDMVRLLLNAGADVQIPNKNGGWTVLHWACNNGASHDIIEHIIRAGGDPNVKNSNGNTPADLARQNHFFDTAFYVEQCYRPTKSANFIA